MNALLRVALWTLCWLASAATAGTGTRDSEPAAIWIDTDPACHLPGWHDVDDCLALRWLLRSPRVRVRGIASVAGNTPQALSLRELRSVLEHIGHDELSGKDLVLASSADSGPKTRTAAAALAAALERERLIVIALGPLTNIAQALRQRPELASRIDAVFFVGGTAPERSMQLGGQRWTHFHDRNVTHDAAALSSVLARGVPLFLIPFHGMAGLRMQSGDFGALVADSPALAAAVQAWASIWRQRLGIDGFVPFDLVAAAAVTHRELFDCQPVKVALRDPPWALTTLQRALTVNPDAGAHGTYSCHPRDIKLLEKLLSGALLQCDRRRQALSKTWPMSRARLELPSQASWSSVRARQEVSRDSTLVGSRLALLSALQAGTL